MNRLRIILFTAILGLLSFCLLTCGIEDYYYLPQIPQNYIQWELNTEASIIIPSIPTGSTDFYYATGYIIFYKIYLSNHFTDSSDITGLINQTLVNDYNAFLPLTDPANTTSIPALDSFSRRNFHELVFINTTNNAQVHPLNTSGGILNIRFPTNDLDYPTAVLRNSANTVTIFESNLGRTSTLYYFRDNRWQSDIAEPKDDPFFQNTAGLNDNSNATSSVNSDVAAFSGGTPFHAYAAMYIAAVGQNPANFQRIYSKPTFISVFKLPNSY